MMNKDISIPVCYDTPISSCIIVYVHILCIYCAYTVHTLCIHCAHTVHILCIHTVYVTVKPSLLDVYSAAS